MHHYFAPNVDSNNDNVEQFPHSENIYIYWVQLKPIGSWDTYAYS